MWHPTAAPQALLDLAKCGCTSGYSTQRCRCRICKDILTGMKFVSAQTARVRHTSKHHSLHTMTKRLMVTHDLILHCVVLLQLECWKSQLDHSCILDHYMFYNLQPCIYPSVQRMKEKGDHRPRNSAQYERVVELLIMHKAKWTPRQISLLPSVSRPRSIIRQLRKSQYLHINVY